MRPVPKGGSNARADWNHRRSAGPLGLCSLTRDERMPALTLFRSLLRNAPAILGSTATLLIVACRAEPRPAAREVVGWRRVGSWAARGDFQTGSFTSDTGGFRVQWKTTHETAPGTGTFKVV